MPPGSGRATPAGCSSPARRRTAIEGFCGSALQVDWIASRGRDPLPPDFAVLHLHALNPYGFAWLRRVNEDGVDLNRNFVDFAKPLPANPGYDELHAALLPESTAPDGAGPRGRRDRGLRQAAWRSGRSRWRSRRASTPSRPACSTAAPRRHGRGGRWRRSSTDFALTRRHVVAVVDLHTGLGPFGYGELICDHPPAARRRCAAAAGTASR